MGILKQEFYEGAALHQIVRYCDGVRITYAAPFFVLNDQVRLHLKYSTGVRSPWGFTFPPDEQSLLYERADNQPLVMGLICAADGIVALIDNLWPPCSQPNFQLLTQLAHCMPQ